MELSHQIKVPVASKPNKNPSKLAQPHIHAEGCGEETSLSLSGIEPEGDILYIRTTLSRFQMAAGVNYQQH
jgi:hypothetical protein